MELFEYGYYVSTLSVVIYCLTTALLIGVVLHQRFTIKNLKERVNSLSASLSEQMVNYCKGGKIE